MHKLRNFLSWLFAISSLICLRIALLSIPRIIHRHYAILSFRDLLVPTVFSVLAIILGVAWWTIWRKKPSARVWGIAASLTYILLPLSVAVYSSRSILSHFSVMLATGVAGLVAFARRFEPSGSTAITQQNPRIPGDGTSRFINSIAAFVNVAVTFAAFLWWIRWVNNKQLPQSHNELYRIALGALVLFAIMILHELGHTATGLALGMKLRAFVAGPFQWRVREGKWEFQFKPQAILSVEGATGVVPASADFAPWRELSMVAAGPLVNLLTGGLALWVVFTATADSPVQTGGLGGLFGAWSLAIGVGNLLPLRAGDNYSDGAQIHQLLSDGPWADYHRAIRVVTSSLVTPLRPRDYDIEAIRRAAHSFTQGKQALLLRLFAYSYFFDRARLLEAGEALGEAESIYHQSASDIPAELLTVFVFGNAYLRRDAAAARQWWTKMQTKRPSRFNVDYWRAYSALQWIEGNLKEANEAWEKSNALAQQLPKAGEYEFDRYCCSKLGEALDEVPIAK